MDNLDRMAAIDLLIDHGMDAAAERLRVVTGTCETCRHWGRRYPHQPQHACNRIVDRKPHVIMPQTEPFTTVDSGIYTPADFSCSLHEAKEPTNG